MTVTLPPWEAWALAALAILGASVIAGLAMAGAVTVLKRRAGGLPAPGDVKRIVVKGDGRVETTDCRTGETEVIPGRCPACQDGRCTWCAPYPIWDEARGRYVHRYQHCPAHQDKERQP